MTEGHWLAWTDPEPMLAFLRGKASARKLRLFAVACCQAVEALLPEEPCLRAVEVARRFADGAAAQQELDEVRADVDEARGRAGVSSDPLLNEAVNAAGQLVLPDFSDPRPAARAAAHAVNVLVNRGGPSVDAWMRNWIASEGANLRFNEALHLAWSAHEAHIRNSGTPLQCACLRDIFGNPFRPVTFDPVWRSPTVVSLAVAAYDKQAFDRLPILADALEDAGCTNNDLLAHLRSTGHHVRGCFAVDLVLGRE